MPGYSIHEAQTDFSRLIAQTLAGEEVIIVRGNTPLVRRVAVTPRGKRSFGALKGQIAMDDSFHEPLPADELSSWSESNPWKFPSPCVGETEVIVVAPHPIAKNRHDATIKI